MCEPRNRDNRASDVWALTAYCFLLTCKGHNVSILIFFYIKHPVQLKGIKHEHNGYFSNTVEPRYNEVLGTMKITLLYQVSHIRVKNPKKYKELGPAKLPSYKRVMLYPTSL